MNSKRVLIAAGGTGGHLYPGLALAKTLTRRGHEVQFAVRPGDISIKVLEREGFSFWTVHASGLPRTFSPGKAILSLVNASRGFREACRSIRRWKPHALAGMGGHVSFPVVLAGRLLRVPTVLHEQNVLPGLANRMLAPWVNLVAVSFPETLKNFGKKSVLVGNPVRDEFKKTLPSSLARKAFGLAESRPTVLVFGGSLGAHALNDIIVQSLPLLSDVFGNIQFLHLTGPQDAFRVEQAYERHGIKARVLERTDEMASAYAAANLVLCRSGAGTVAELIAVKKPALLIPYPYASENHQKENALVLARRGWAEVLEQQQLNPQDLVTAIHHWIQIPPERLPSGTDTGIPNPLEAAERLADLVEKISN